MRIATTRHSAAAAAVVLAQGSTAAEVAAEVRTAAVAGRRALQTAGSCTAKERRILLWTHA